MKPAELRDMTLEELEAKEKEVVKELFNLRMRHSGNQLENPLSLRSLRRDVARIKTAIALRGRGTQDVR